MMALRAGLWSVALLLGNACGDNKTTATPEDSAPHAPIAVTNGDHTVAEGSSVTLDGTSSSDADGDIIAYAWTQTAGPTSDGSLSGANTAVATFSAPGVGSTAVFRFTLTVTDLGGRSDQAIVSVTVIDLNAAPIADAGPDVETDALQVVTLVGSGNDSDGDVQSYAWIQVSGPDAGSITHADQPSASVTAPDVNQPLIMVFELTVTDDEGKAGSDTVQVEVRPVAAAIRVQSLPAGQVLRNAVWEPLDVEVNNAAGARILAGGPASLQISIEALLENGSSALGTLSGTLTKVAVGGRAQFTDLAYDRVTEEGNALVIKAKATATGLAPAFSEPIPVVWPSLLPGGIESDDDIEPTAVVLVNDASGSDILVAGSFVGTDVDFDLAAGGTDLQTSSNRDGFVARYRGNNGELRWVRTVTGVLEEDEEVTALAATNDGAIWLTVAYGGTDVVFLTDSGTWVLPPSGGDGGDKVAIARLSSADGFTQWAGAITGAGDHRAFSVAVSASGNPAIAGSFAGTDVEFDPDPDGGGHTSSSNTAEPDAFILKLDATGAYVWHTVIGGPSEDRALGVSHHPTSSDVYAVGSYGSASFIARLDVHDGSQQWPTQTIGGTVLATALLTEPGGSMWVAGMFEETVDFDPDASGSHELTTTLAAPFVARYSATGAFELVTTYSAETAIDIQGMAYSNAIPQSIIVVGRFRGNARFDPLDSGFTVEGPTGHDAGYVLSLEAGDGAFEWVGLIESADTLNSPVSAVDADGVGIVISGGIGNAGTVDIDPGPSIVDKTLSVGPGAFLTKLDEQGIVVP